jgi:hypothetical protein
VAQAWIPNIDPTQTTVNHKNRNKTDNNISNLEWLSHKEQSKHFTRTLEYYSSQKNNDVQDTSTCTRNYDMQDNIEGEIWKIIDKAPSYSVSNMGRIRLNKFNRIVPGHTKSVYDQVKIHNHAKQYKTSYIHKLVAEAFLLNYDPNLVVNHKDGNKKNNCLSNLECITQSDNIRHSYEIGKHRRQVAIQQFSLTNEFIQEHQSFANAGRITGLRDSSIRWALINKKPHGGFIWRRSDAQTLL